MHYFIGIDSGGTKTDTVLFDETGHILYRDLSGGCNGLDIGFEEARDRTLAIITRVSTHAPETVSSIYAGMAGAIYFGEEIGEYVRPRISAKNLRIEMDAGNLISGTLGTGSGCCMICGTGATLVVRLNDRSLVRIGGRGYLVDTDGSGFRLGQEVLKRAFRCIDGRSGPTILADMLKKEADIDGKEFIPRLYAGGRSYVASFAHLAFEGRLLGDRTCYEIIESGSDRLADLTWAAENTLTENFLW